MLILDGNVKQLLFNCRLWLIKAEGRQAEEGGEWEAVWGWWEKGVASTGDVVCKGGINSSLSALQLAVEWDRGKPWVSASTMTTRSLRMRTVVHYLPILCSKEGNLVKFWAWKYSYSTIPEMIWSRSNAHPTHFYICYKNLTNLYLYLRLLINKDTVD